VFRGHVVLGPSDGFAGVYVSADVLGHSLDYIGPTPNHLPSDEGLTRKSELGNEDLA
jgi:hypothetical protein